jgi:hypothetical protein
VIELALTLDRGAVAIWQTDSIIAGLPAASLSTIVLADK